MIDGPYQNELFAPEQPDALDRFRQFHADNPQIYAALVELSRRAKAKGYSKWSTKAAFEVLRWESTVRTTGDSEFKLRNDFTALYARLIMQREPDLDGFFVTRASRFAQ